MGHSQLAACSHVTPDEVCFALPRGIAVTREVGIAKMGAASSLRPLLGNSCSLGVLLLALWTLGNPPETTALKTVGPVHNSAQLYKALADNSVQRVELDSDLVFEESVWVKPVIITRNVTVISVSAEKGYRVIDLNHLYCRIQLFPGVQLTFQHVYLYRFRTTPQEAAGGMRFVFAVSCSSPFANKL